MIRGTRTRRPQPHPRVWSRRTHDERGSASVFVVGMAITLFACAGLVLDGGTALNARMQLADQVEQAARAGAQQIDITELRTHGVVVLDETAARDRAVDHLRSVGRTAGSVQVVDGEITVSARDSVDSVMLSIIGVDTFTISASATSAAVTR